MKEDLLSCYLEDIEKYEKLGREEEIELLKRAQKGDKEAREKLILSNLILVVNVAKKYNYIGISHIDIISEGNFGLITAIDKFNLKFGYRFATYAVWWIKQSINKAIMNTSRGIRLPSYRYSLIAKINRVIATKIAEEGKHPTDEEIAKILNVSVESVVNTLSEFNEIVSLNAPIGDHISLEDAVSDKTSCDIEEEVIKHLSEIEIHDILERLSERERIILKKRYGFDGEQIHTLADIGEFFNITRERVRQVERKILKKIKVKYSDKLKENYYY